MPVKQKTKGNSKTNFQLLLKKQKQKQK